jgi:hypothetical protein
MLLTAETIAQAYRDFSFDNADEVYCFPEEEQKIKP